MARLLLGADEEVFCEETAQGAGYRRVHPRLRLRSKQPSSAIIASSSRISGFARAARQPVFDFSTPRHFEAAVSPI
jgi:hypothetical protein